MIYYEKFMLIMLKLSEIITYTCTVYKSRQAFDNKWLEYYFSKIITYSFTNLESAHSPDKTDNAMDL